MSIDVAIPASRAMTFGNRSQPNDVDLRRVSHLVERRAGYQKVPVRVEAIANGYRVVSSTRASESDGQVGAIDIAWLEYDEALQVWRLYSRDHECGEWLHYDSGRQIDALMVNLIADPYGVFWH